jgi:RNA polymerase sigma factor (sigma-70 family)
VKNWLEEYAPRVYRFARRLTGDLHAAEDLTQEALVRAWQRRRHLRDPAAARVWLFTIAANLWRDQLRRRRSPVARAGSLKDDDRLDTQTPELNAEHKEEVGLALTALQALPPRQREVLYLNACEGLSISDIARVLDIGPDSAKASLSLARKKMRELLHDVCQDDPRGV